MVKPVLSPCDPNKYPHQSAPDAGHEVPVEPEQAQVAAPGGVCKVYQGNGRVCGLPQGTEGEEAQERQADEHVHGVHGRDEVEVAAGNVCAEVNTGLLQGGPPDRLRCHEAEAQRSGEHQPQAVVFPLFLPEGNGRQHDGEAAGRYEEGAGQEGPWQAEPLKLATASSDECCHQPHEKHTDTGQRKPQHQAHRVHLAQVGASAGIRQGVAFGGMCHVSAHS